MSLLKQFNSLLRFPFPFDFYPQVSSAHALRRLDR
jgi:hypothetical protein